MKMELKKLKKWPLGSQAPAVHSPATSQPGVAGRCLAGGNGMTGNNRTLSRAVQRGVGNGGECRNLN